MFGENLQFMESTVEHEGITFHVCPRYGQRDARESVRYVGTAL